MYSFVLACYATVINSCGCGYRVDAWVNICFATSSYRGGRTSLDFIFSLLATHPRSRLVLRPRPFFRKKGCRAWSLETSYRAREALAIG